MTEEARKFTLLATAVSKLPESQKYSFQQQPQPHQGPTLDQRVHALETTLLERTQKMLHGVMEDISELHSRVDKIQNPVSSWDTEHDEFPIPWSSPPRETTYAYDRGFTFPVSKNEIVSELGTRVIHIKEDPVLEEEIRQKRKRQKSQSQRQK